LDFGQKQHKGLIGSLPPVLAISYSDETFLSFRPTNLARKDVLCFFSNLADVG
jgi:hypothetical protein